MKAMALIPRAVAACSRENPPRLLRRAHPRGYQNAVVPSAIHFVPTHLTALTAIEEYLEANGHRGEAAGPLFRPIKNDRSSGRLAAALTPGGVYVAVGCHSAVAAGISVHGFGPHALRAIAATNALDHEAGIARIINRCCAMVRRAVWRAGLSKSRTISSLCGWWTAKPALI